jgi:predicted membrane protein DUF2207
VARSAADGEGVVAVTALTSALGPGSVRTWGQFSTAVRAAAVRAGLVRGRSGGRGVTGPSVAVATVVSAGCLVVVPPLWLLVAVVWPVTLLVAIVVLVWGHGQTLTPEGRAAAAHWLGVRRFLDEQDNLDDLPPGAVAVWDRYLAYGAALGQSGAAVKGLGDEVRTRMSLADANRVRRMIRDPAAMAAEMRATNQAEMAQRYGPDVGADQVLGPDDGDFWTLVERTAGGWMIGMRALVSDPGLWAAAARRRLAAIEKAAPPDLAADVAALAPLVHRAADAADAGGAKAMDGAFEGVDLTTGPMAAPASRLLAAAGAHYGCGPDPAVLARRLGFDGVGGQR